MADEPPYTAADIKVLTGREAVRLRPEMYIGDTKDGSGIRHMFLEVFSNSVDEVFGNDNAHVEVISVYPDIIIRDNGRGIPVAKLPNIDLTAMELILTQIHSGSTFDGHWPHFHMGHNAGVGLSVVNFLSERIQVKSWRQGNLWMCEYEKGICTIRPKIIETGTGVGTEIKFRPDPEIFETFVDPTDGWIKDVSNAAYLCPKIKYTYLGEEFYSESGLADLTQALNPRFSLSETVGEFSVNVAIGGTAETETQWTSWVNGTKTPYHGSHVTAIKTALKKIGWTPEIVLIHAIGKTARFSGPTRGELYAPELVDPLTTMIFNEFQKEGG